MNSKTEDTDMHELTKEDKAHRDDMITRLDAASEKIAAQTEAADEKITELNDSIQEYNNVLKEVDQFADEVVKRIEDYAGSKSEGWKEEKGDVYEDWVTHWSNINLSPMDLIEEVVLDDMEHSKELADLPETPES